MSVEAEEIDELESTEPIRTKWVFRSDSEWQRIRANYETAQPPIPLRALAKQEAIPVSTMLKRSAREGWKQPRGIIQRTRNALVQATDEAIHLAVQDAAKATAASLVDQLQPLIEKEKAEHIKTQIIRSKGHLSRLDSFLKRKRPLEPKDESYLSKAITTHVQDLRRTLGMNEGSGLGGSLSIQVLTNQAAVQVTQK